MSRLRINSIRAWLLQLTFSALYGPLVFLHEPAGVLLAGNAWPVRRKRLLSIAESDRATLDLGCGSGILLSDIRKQTLCAVGVDPSPEMRRLARWRGLNVLAGSSYCIPLDDHSIDRVLISYPGPWIRSPETWSELERVSRPDAQIAVLLGGSYTTGHCSRLRQILTRIGYGPQSDQFRTLVDSRLGSSGIQGSERYLVDRWGIAYYWVGRRV